MSFERDHILLLQEDGLERKHILPTAVLYWSKDSELHLNLEKSLRSIMTPWGDRI